MQLIYAIQTSCGRFTMTSDWQYQVRFDVKDAATAESVRRGQPEPALAPLSDILAKHRALAKCQFDAFAEYVAEAEARGLEHYPLYAWTKATIENPAKKEKYLKSFTLSMPRKPPMRWRRICSRSPPAGSSRDYRNTIPIRPTTRSHRKRLASRPRQASLAARIRDVCLRKNNAAMGRAR